DCPHRGADSINYPTPSGNWNFRLGALIEFYRSSRPGGSTVPPVRSVLYFAVVIAACGSPGNSPPGDGTGMVDGTGSGSGSGSNPGSGSSTPPGAISIIVEPNGNKGQEVVDAINAA